MNSALALGFFYMQKQEYALFLAAFGLFVSWLWFRVNLGSKFWQSRWDHRLNEIEKKIDPALHFFAVDLPTIRSDVKNSLENNKHEGRFRRWLDKQVLKKALGKSPHDLIVGFLHAWLGNSCNSFSVGVVAR